MPNQDALTLAKVAIEAQKRYCEVYVPSHYREHGLFGKSGVLISPEDFIAAAIDRHMERSKTFFEHISPDTLAPLYRITQEPRGGEDGK